MSRYQPNPVPADLNDLQRYIDVELTRIRDVVNVKVDRAYGGLIEEPPPATILLPNPSPVLFNPYTKEIPARPDGVNPDLASGSLTILSGGTFLVNFKTSIINIAPNEQWNLFLYVNGVQSSIGGTASPSNQTEIVSVSFSGYYQATKGDTFTVLIDSPTSSDADVVSSSFTANRVSETTD